VIKGDNAVWSRYYFVRVICDVLLWLSHTDVCSTQVL